LPINVDEKGIDVDTGIPELNLTIDPNGFDSKGYYYIKQEDGTYINTGLKHNLAGFRKDGVHIITQEQYDIRFFNMYGQCLKNNRLKNDENGFLQDGRHASFGEYYYRGYNAFGLNQNGEDINGKKPLECKFAEAYINAVKKGKTQSFVKANSKIINLFVHLFPSKDPRLALNLILYKASLMNPKIKEDMCNYIVLCQKNIKSRELKLKQLKENEKENKELIEKYENENKILKRRISALDIMHDFEE